MKKISLILLSFLMSLTALSQIVTDECKTQEATLSWLSNKIVENLDGEKMDNGEYESGLLIFAVDLPKYTTLNTVRTKVDAFLGQYNDIFIEQSWDAQIDPNGNLCCSVVYVYKDGFIMLFFYPEVSLLAISYPSAKMICGKNQK